jgi:hypothetical protein
MSQQQNVASSTKAHSERAALRHVTACYQLYQSSDKVMYTKHRLSDQLQTDRCVKYQIKEI